VSGKKVHQRIHIYNACKQYQVLTKLCTNNVTSNLNPITKFQKNSSTSAKVTAILVSSPENIKCPLLETFRHVTIKCKSQTCVQNILHVLKCKLDDVNVTV